MKEFNSVIGYAGIKNELERLCDVLKNREKYERLGVTMPAGLLLYGAPGVGKTTMANCLLNALGRQTFLCRKSKPDGDFINEIKRIFEEAKNHTPSVVFLDDLDKFANNDERHVNSEEYVTVQSCIDGVKGSNVFVVATANDIRSLPDSLLRSGRFDRTIEVEVPRGKDAKAILAHYLSQKKFVAEFDVGEIAEILAGKSCADLETVINEAGIYAGFAGKDKIGKEDIIQACMRVIFEAPEGENDYSDDARRRIACHEAGHAVIAEVLEKGSVNLISVRIHESRTGGMASLSQSPDYFTRMDCMENRVLSLLGGRAAIEIVYGEVDTGAMSDMRRAYDIICRIVTRYAAYGIEKYCTEDAGEQLTDRTDIIVSAELERYYMHAKKLLVENREFLEKLAAALYEKKTLCGSDVRAIKAACKKQAA